MLTERQRIFNELAKRADRLNSVADVCLDEIARLRAIESEVLQAQEPVAWRKKADGALWSIPQFRQLVSVLHVGFEPLYTAPQPPAPCPKCAEQSAEIARLKTVPMKYRRMAFNAQLQDENARLGERIAELEKEVETLEYEILALTELDGQ